MDSATPPGKLVDLGASATVEVPATSANLGPGFDSFGLALDWRDRLTATVANPPHAVEVTGEGAGTVPRDGRHLVLASLLHGLADLGCTVPGLRLVAHSTIPHGRGLGSSAAAIVAGLLLARRLAGDDPDPEWLVRQASAVEGHPDNVAAAVLGGFTIAATGPSGEVRAVSSRIRADLGALLFVPADAVPTATARGLLPDSVPHADAAANAARAALLVHALAEDPDLLLSATEDWLHTRFRQPAMPASYALVQRLRERGHAAVVSGAGPTVLVLGRRADLGAAAGEPSIGFVPRVLAVGSGARVV